VKKVSQEVIALTTSRSIRSRLIVLAMVLALAFGSLLPLGQVRAAAPGPDLIGTSIVADIAEANMSKVVWITANFEKQVQSFFFGKKKQQFQGFGSGFFFDEQGHILTNAHVVAGAQSIEVTLQGQKKPLPATVVGLDTEFDLAILKVDLAEPASYFRFGDSDRIRVGEWVVAIGNPYGLDHTVTQGIISAKGRPLTAGEDNGDSTTYENMLQTDAAINPGNSGGPLLNLQGEVIGINTAVSSAGQNLSFAIPINTVKENLEELMAKGRLSHPWIGAAMIDLKLLDTKARAALSISTAEGVLIGPVKGGPADKAGLRTYDLVIRVDEQEISGVDDLIKIIRQHKVGDQLAIQFIRKGNPLSVKLLLEEKPQPKR
jgi:S1-C subfamily serine protease